ncbi:GAP family protein [Mycobacterium xenopi]|nr:GAP family protein [Mycobacterium xenopi]MDA3659967.1 GAP family protein [Mycobacterium xenopi]MDA3664231.1 GAP family protein [Mycobacterium xenopi]
MALGCGLLTGFDPMRLGITLLVISRPRPVQNLLAYGVGNLIACMFTVVVPLAVLHNTRVLKSFADRFATSSTVRHIQLGIGVLALSIAAVLVVRALTRRPQRAQVPAAGGNSSTLVLDADSPNPITRLLGRAQDASTGGGSAITRLLGRMYNSWENGSLWVSWVIGLGSGPPLDGVFFLLTFIVASGVAIGAQASAAIAFVVGMLAVVEITLLCYLAKPAKTQAVVQRLHDWARAHRQKILIAMCTVGGVALVVSGMASA